MTLWGNPGRRDISVFLPCNEKQKMESSDICCLLPRAYFCLARQAGGENLAIWNLSRWSHCYSEFLELSSVLLRKQNLEERFC